MKTLKVLSFMLLSMLLFLNSCSTDDEDLKKEETITNTVKDETEDPKKSEDLEPTDPKDPAEPEEQEPKVAKVFPQVLATVYDIEPSMEFSDEFNGNRQSNSFDTSKWHHRESKPWRKGIGVGQEFVEEKDGKLICYGRKSKRQAGGIISNQYFQFGFYAFRFKTTGMPYNKRNAWHPSIWGSLSDAKNRSVPGTTGNNSNWMEIDIMEFSTWSKTNTDWSADAPAYLWVESLKKKVKVNKDEGPTFGWKKAVMLDGKKDAYKGVVIGKKNHDQWKTFGMEYHKDYLQMWMLNGNEWVKVGHTITFTDNATKKPSLRTVPRIAVKPLYWYFGNLYLPHGNTEIQEYQISNSTLEIDWFHFHKLK